MATSAYTSGVSHGLSDAQTSQSWKCELVYSSTRKITGRSDPDDATFLCNQVDDLPSAIGWIYLDRSLSNGFSVRVFDIEDKICETCINFLKSLGLNYGAIDFVLDKNDRLVFLEVNPTGDWYWIENKVKLPITKAMVDLIEGLI